MLSCLRVVLLCVMCSIGAGVVQAQGVSTTLPTSILAMGKLPQNSSNAEKFNWKEAVAAPVGYPVEVYSGGLISSEDGHYTSLYMGLSVGPWGNYEGGMRGGVKRLPDRLKVIWVAYAEDKVYEIDTPIDYERILAHFREGYYVPSLYEPTEPDTTERLWDYNTISVGFAPGGHVMIWVAGMAHSLEVGHYQGHEITIPQAEIDQLDEPNRLMFDAKWRQRIMADERIVPADAKPKSKDDISAERWLKYREVYPWKLELHLPERLHTNVVFTNFYNGAIWQKYGDIQIKKFPQVYENFRWHSLYYNVPSRLSIAGYIGPTARHLVVFYFDEDEIFKAFQTLAMQGEQSEEHALRMVVRANDALTHARVSLANDQQEIKLDKAKLKLVHPKESQ